MFSPTLGQFCQVMVSERFELVPQLLPAFTLIVLFAPGVLLKLTTRFRVP
jgi:hypothetical protein